MFAIWVYALKFEDGAIYVGITGDFERRLQEHERRQSPSTRRHDGCFTVIYRRVFRSYAEARSHEKYLKAGSGKKLLRSVNP